MIKIMVVLVFSVLFSCKEENLSQERSIKSKGTIIDIEITSATRADSVIVTDAEFENWKSFSDKPKITAHFNRNVPHLYKIAFYINGRPYLNDKELWLTNGEPKIKLHFTGNAVIIDTVIDSPIYYEYFSLLKELDKFDKSQDSTYRNEYLLKKIRQNFNNSFSNLFSANYLSYNRSKPKNLKKLYSIISKQDDDVKNSVMAVHKNLLQIINLKRFDLQSFILLGREGDTIRPDAQNEKLCLLDFWFVKCKPCVADHKLIQRRLDDFKNRDIVVVGISTDLQYADWHNYLDEHNYNWLNYKQIDAINNNPASTLGIYEYPTYVIVNGDGEIAPKRYNSVKDEFKDYLDK